ncbi:MAG: Glu-tRNA(Gln) amidotransferase subunit GatE [Candidatus Parvarchaeota archaeon]|jgi:glutamyl-tRNA(Gln) amidotransferase subunit E|nr:Glu-tRNA(Gln) amidotransferase subunit GatE [Candidatus Parvarchaeota archaeon]MCL5106954.1 Glu-tRNA(Gln) amidotransferase subunit GatE [Candidatus Parvarchaeota archaeon]
MKIRCGFEWHIQVDSGKLFCRCKSEIKENKDYFEIRRLIRPSFGESGKIDISAEFEGKKTKKIVYKVFNDADCLVDIDEEPPHDIDKDALSTGVNLAYALDAYLLNNLIFMRKTIVDGSNTTGFQRTAILAVNGEFPFKEKKIKIDTISIEEDSARKETENREETVYFLDRIGIPLIEIATGIIETDENEAKDIAMQFGKFTRLFNVKRGIGTIRQDVNLSIEGGKRVELKGFQNIREMDKVILNEAKRQENLIKIKNDWSYIADEIKKWQFEDIKEMFDGTESNMVKTALKNGKSIIGMKLTGLNGLLGTYVCENKRFGSEISDYLRVKLGYGIMHSDELPAYGISEDEKRRILERLHCSEKDSFLFSICDKEYENTAIAVIKERIISLLKEVPSEVRLVQEDNTTRFLRPMGGKDRMYVETDLPIIKIDKEILKEGKEYIGRNVDSLKASLNISDEFLDQLISSRKLSEAVYLNKKTGLDFSVIIQVAIEDWKYIKRRFGKEIDKEDIEEILEQIKKNGIARDSARIIMEGIALTDKSVEDIIKEKGLKKKTNEELKKEIEKLIKDKKLDKVDSLIINLKDRIGTTFEAKEAYRIALEMIKDEKN